MPIPSSAMHAATKQYVDNMSQGLSWKDSVRVATTANGTLASAFQNAAVVDGVTLATGNRILLKNQTAPAENGIYTVNASGAPTRATDADVAVEIEGAAVFVQEGTTQQDTAWVLTTNPPITLGTTGLVFAQFGAGATYAAGAGLTLTTNTFDVVAGDATIVVAADAITRAALTGDVTTVVNAATIAAGVVSNSKLATMPANTIKMNNTAGVASPTDVTSPMRRQRWRSRRCRSPSPTAALGATRRRRPTVLSQLAPRRQASSRPSTQRHQAG